MSVVVKGAEGPIRITGFIDETAISTGIWFYPTDPEVHFAHASKRQALESL